MARKTWTKDYKFKGQNFHSYATVRRAAQAEANATGKSQDFYLIGRSSSGGKSWKPYLIQPSRGKRLSAVRNPSRNIITAKRVRIDRQGYDKDGRYWGVGQPLFYWSYYRDNGGAIKDDIEEYGYMRAYDSAEVRSKIQKKFGARVSRKEWVKQNPNIVTPLKALIGKTLKIVKQGGKIVGIPVGRR